MGNDRVRNSVVCAGFTIAASLIGCSGGGSSGTSMPSNLATTPPSSVGSATPSAVGSAMPSASATASGPPVSIDADAPVLATVSSADVYGGNFFAYDAPTEAPILPALKTANVHLVRYPGGATSDFFHWQTNSYSSCFSQYFPTTPTVVMDTDQFYTDVVQPLGADVNVTVNYGTNPDCTGGADPSEATDWVTYTNVTNHYGFKYWTIGNEQYFSGPNGPTVDLHSPPGAATYANLLATQYYPNMKAVDPTIQIGVDLAAPYNNASSQTQTWDSTVLQNAKYDFVEVHPVPQNTGSQSNDTFLLTQGPSYYASAIALVRSELSAAGKPSTPIYVGEWNADDGTPPKEHVTIVGGLWAAMTIGEFLDAGLNLATFYSGVESDCSAVASADTADYGWPTFATFSLINESANASANGCPGSALPPVGTPYPPAIAMDIDANTFAVGDSMIAPSVSPALANLRVYASKRASGYGLLLVNIDQNNPISTNVSILNDGRTFSGSGLSYTKAQFDEGATGTFPGPTPLTLTNVTGSFPVTLPPWSMTGISLSTTTTMSRPRAGRSRTHARFTTRPT